MQPDETGEHPKNVIVKVGDKYFMSVALLEYDMKAAKTPEQIAGVQEVMDAHRSMGSTKEVEVAFFTPKPGIPIPLNTGFF